MRTYCLINHTLTDNQIEELRVKFHSTEVIYPPAELSAGWSQIPPAETLCMPVLAAVIRWLGDAEKGDTFIVQGEFGSTFYLVDYALQRGLVPIHAVTRRVAKEEREGEVVKKTFMFKHECFRKYIRYKSKTSSSISTDVC